MTKPRSEVDERLLGELGRLLDGDPGGDPGSSAALRSRLLVRTSGLVRRRARRRRWLGLVVVALAFAAGVGTGLVIDPGSRPAPRAAPPAIERPLEETTPHELERRALEAAGERRRHLLKEAGDRYLSERGDVMASLRCYEAVLGGRGPEPDWNRDDSWLLIALKASDE